jgi:hypothetical protein
VADNGPLGLLRRSKYLRSRRPAPHEVRLCADEKGSQGSGALPRWGMTLNTRYNVKNRSLTASR